MSYHIFKAEIKPASHTQNESAYMGKNLFFRGPEDIGDYISKDEALTRLFEAWQPHGKTETV